MRLSEVSYIRQAENSCVKLCSGEAGPDANYISVLSGENGVGKSTLLRIISDFSLGRNHSRQPGSFVDGISGIVAGGDIKKTIALSGTINDRFPNNASRDLRIEVNSFDLEEFYYFGPKYSGGIASQSRASNNITKGVLESIAPEWRPGENLSSLLGYMGLGDNIIFNFSIGSRHRKDKVRSLALLYERTQKATSRSSEMPASMSNAVNILRHIVENRIDVSAPGKRGGFEEVSTNIRSGEIRINPQKFPQVSKVSEDLGLCFNQVISAFLSLGIIDARVTFLRAADGVHVELSEMSSGQWQLVNCMFNLGVLAEDNTLVLVDEPENSLHPQWQRDYVKTLRKMVSHRFGCHIILATHSPLIVASILPREGEVISLRQPDHREKIVTFSEGSTYGWSTGDVL